MNAPAKDVAIIASGGRSGSTFFGDLLSEMIPDSFSVHEPDILDGLSGRSWRAIRSFGPRHMIVGRLSGRTGIRNLSQRYLAGSLSLPALAEALRTHRSRYYAGCSKPLLIESYYQWYGVLDAVPLAFPGAKVLCIVRDPRDWVRSYVNYGGHHDGRDKVALWGQSRLTPAMIGDTVNAARWQTMSPFEKNCWDWRIITGLLLRQRDRAPAQTRVYRFEDLFLSSDRAAHVKGLLSFTTDFPSRKYPFQLDERLLDKPQNTSNANRCSHWRDWDAAEAQILHSHCGDLMRHFGYGNEAGWCAKLAAMSGRSGNMVR